MAKVKIDISVSPERIEAPDEEILAEVDEGAPETEEIADAKAAEAIKESKAIRKAATS